jgi:heat-inducible transcriptional repressor
MTELSARQQAILKMVIRDYVSSAAPVSSKGLARHYGLDLSSATIRNELAVLEELGFLTHPHTSAGRVPTERGYRYFVENLMDETELALPDRRMIAHQFHQVRLNVEQWMRLAAAVLVRASRSAALVTAPHAAQARCKHVQLIATQGRLVLLIVVFEDGTVKQEMLTLAEPMSQERLNEASERLNAICKGRSFDAMPAQWAELPRFETEVLGVVMAVLKQASARPAGEVYQDGLAEVLRQPEFVDRDETAAILRVLEEQTLLEEVFSHALSPGVGNVQVVIGGEGRWEDLRDYSLVLARYGVSDYATGALGVLGPMRMPYGRTVSTMRYVADLMSNLISDMYSGDEESSTGD